MKKKIFAFIVLIMGLSLVTGCGDTKTDGGKKEDKIKIIIVHEVSDEHLVGVGANTIRDLVKERLDDKVEVEVHPNGALFNVEKGAEALQAGNVHMVLTSSSKLVGYDPGYQLYDLPFLFDSAESVTKFNETDIGQELMEKVESFDLKILDIWNGTYSQFTNSSHPIVTPEDMEGLKFRVMAGGLLADQFTELGAGATVIPFSDLYMSLQQGVIEGQENPFLEISSSNLHEVQKYMTISNHKISTYPVLTNKDFWEGLPEDVREELEKIMEEVNTKLVKTAEELDEESLQKIVDSGKMEIVELTEEQHTDFKEKLQPLYVKYGEIIGQDRIDEALNIK